MPGRSAAIGKIVIIDHGDGWTSLVTGLGGARRRGAATAWPGRTDRPRRRGEAPRVTVELRRRGRPIDMTALLG